MVVRKRKIKRGGCRMAQSGATHLLSTKTTSEKGGKILEGKKKKRELNAKLGGR